LPSGHLCKALRGPWADEYLPNMLLCEALSKRKGIPVDVILCSDEERIKGLDSGGNPEIHDPLRG